MNLSLLFTDRVFTNLIGVSDRSIFKKIPGILFIWLSGEILYWSFYFQFAIYGHLVHKKEMT